MPVNQIQNSIPLPNLNSKSFEQITEKGLITPFKSMPTSKSPGDDALTKEFNEHFWKNLKFFFINSLKQSKIDGHLYFSEASNYKTNNER